jgi:hypothetical protein
VMVPYNHTTTFSPTMHGRAQCHTSEGESYTKETTPSCGVVRVRAWQEPLLCPNERREMRRRIWMERKIKTRAYVHICMTIEGVWIQVVQLNKFGLLNFHFTNSWT